MSAPDSYNFGNALMTGTLITMGSGEDAVNYVAKSISQELTATLMRTLGANSDVATGTLTGIRDPEKCGFVLVAKSGTAVPGLLTAFEYAGKTRLIHRVSKTINQGQLDGWAIETEEVPSGAAE